MSWEALLHEFTAYLPPCSAPSLSRVYAAPVSRLQSGRAVPGWLELASWPLITRAFYDWLLQTATMWWTAAPPPPCSPERTASASCRGCALMCMCCCRLRTSRRKLCWTCCAAAAPQPSSARLLPAERQTPVLNAPCPCRSRRWATGTWSLSARCPMTSAPSGRWVDNLLCHLGWPVLYRPVHPTVRTLTRFACHPQTVTQRPLSVSWPTPRPSHAPLMRSPCCTALRPPWWRAALRASAWCSAGVSWSLPAAAVCCCVLLSLPLLFATLCGIATLGGKLGMWRTPAPRIKQATHQLPTSHDDPPPARAPTCCRCLS